MAGLTDLAADELVRLGRLLRTKSKAPDQQQKDDPKQDQCLYFIQFVEARTTVPRIVARSRNRAAPERVRFSLAVARLESSGLTLLDRTAKSASTNPPAAKNEK